MKPSSSNVEVVRVSVTDFLPEGMVNSMAGMGEKNRKKDSSKSKGRRSALSGNDTGQTISIYRNINGEIVHENYNVSLSELMVDSMSEVRKKK